MGKKQDQIFQQLTQAINDLKNPANNPAQNFLTTEAMDAANKLKAKDYSNLGTGMFFDFKNPIEQMKQYDQMNNIGKEGTYALGDNAGAGAAMNLAADYRKNLFARDAAENFQDNIRTAGQNVTAALGGAAAAKGQTDATVINALQGLYGSIPKGPGIGWQLLGGAMNAGSGLGSAFLTRGK